MNKPQREIYDWDPKSPWKYRSRTEAKSLFDVRAINEIKWYFFDKKRAHGVEESRFIQGRASTVDGGQAFGRVPEHRVPERISPSTPSSLGWYWRRAYHMSLLCVSVAHTLWKDKFARDARHAILLQSYMIIMRIAWHRRYYLTLHHDIAVTVEKITCFISTREV